MSTDPRIDRLSKAEPCGVIREGRAMTVVRLEDAHAAAELIEILQANQAHLQRDLEMITSTKDRLLADVTSLIKRIDKAKLILS